MSRAVGPWGSASLLLLPLMTMACSPVADAQATSDDVPEYVVDASFPRPLPNDWIMGQVPAIAVDSEGDVWVLQRPRSLTLREAGAVQDPPIALCCYPAPSVIEFDSDGNVKRSWGGPESESWPGNEHGLYIDHEDNVWLAASGRGDEVVLKFTPDGEQLLQIGQFGVTGGSHETETLGGPADVFVDPLRNEVYVADGYRNRRVIVFDASTGEYKRHWGAYGEPPDDEEDVEVYDPDAPLARSFRSPLHAVVLSQDSIVYVADRSSSRIQTFTKDGDFLGEYFIAPRTLLDVNDSGFGGSTWDMAFSEDPAQRWLFVADGSNMRVWILERATMEVEGHFGTGGKQAGQFEWVHTIAADALGNLYTGEVHHGKRVQKFVRVN